MNRYALINLALVAFCLFGGNVVFAQTEDQGDNGLSNQNIDVYSTYTPVINDAFRIESLPLIIDTIKIDPEFTYDIFSKLQPTTLYPTPLQAAKMEGEPKDHLDHGYAKLGIGSKFGLHGELYYMNTRKSSLNWGVIGTHRSSQGKITNPVDERVYAGFDRSNLTAFAKKMYAYTTLYGDVNFNTSQHFFYGYNPANLSIDTLLMPDDREDFIDGGYRQRYSVLSVNTRAKSHYPEKKKINYDVIFNYALWLDAKKNTEHNIDIKADFNRKIKKEMVGLQSQLLVIPAKYLDPSWMFVDVSPYMRHNAKNFKLKLGLKMKMQFLQDSTKFHFYPDVHIEHNIADVILPYASFTGDLHGNSMLEMSQVNPFINDTSAVIPTNVKQNVCVGLKGRISDEVQFNINGQYHKVENQYFFVNDLTSDLHNRFGLVYSDVEMFKAYAELDFDVSDKLEVRLHGTYNHFTWLKDIDKAWHVPVFSSGLYASYMVNPQLKIHSQAFVEGNRYAGLNVIGTDVWTAVKMKCVVDINLGAEYQVSSQLAAYLQLNNLLGQNYELWYQYPVYGFHFMGGIKYSF